MKTVTAAMLVLALLALSPVWGQANPTPSVNLHLAALMGDIEAVQQHIDTGSDLNEKDAYGSTPLIIAATFGNTDVARALIDGGADLNLTNSDDSTALHTAAFLGRAEIVEALLDHGASKYLRNNFGNTAWSSVASPFEESKPTYDAFAAGLGPLGLELDYAQLQATRPLIAQLLRPGIEELGAVDYTPLPGDDWLVSTPAEQGLDPLRVAGLYLNATELETLYGLLVIKDGLLIAEGYFNEGSLEQKVLLQSVTKSYYSALVGIALEQGCLSSLDQKMMEFFPEFADQLTDPRKMQITIRDMLQMRDGYPWEETDPAYWAGLVTGDYLPLLVDFPLVSDPGTEFHYSNATTYWLGVIVERACGMDLRGFAQEHLFAPLGVELGEWWQDPHEYYYPFFHFSARDAAKFGLLYLDDGVYGGDRIISADWVRDSFQPYSEDAWDYSTGPGPFFRDVGYGYQWWSARSGEHSYDLAWGHGGQLIVLLDEFDMIIVTTADPFFDPDGVLHFQSWPDERAIVNLVSEFIASLPSR